LFEGDCRRLRFTPSASRLLENIVFSLPQAHEPGAREYLDTFHDRSAHSFDRVDLQEPVHKRKRKRGAIHIDRGRKPVVRCTPHP
jgi:hypothetical protein